MDFSVTMQAPHGVAQIRRQRCAAPAAEAHASLCWGEGVTATADRCRRRILRQLLLFGTCWFCSMCVRRCRRWWKDDDEQMLWTLDICVPTPCTARPAVCDAFGFLNSTATTFMLLGCRRARHRGQWLIHCVCKLSQHSELLVSQIDAHLA
jgi:hypothetical protein